MGWRSVCAGPRSWALMPLSSWCTQDPLLLAQVAWTLSGWLIDARRLNASWKRGAPSHGDSEGGIPRGGLRVGFPRFA
jgi:hypothetical protein